MKNIFVSPNDTVKKSMEVIDKGAMKFAVVVDNEKKLLGTITDGDIRRAILKGKNLDDKIKDIYNKNPIYVTSGTEKEKIIEICTKNKIYQIPVVDEHKKVIEIKELDELVKPKKYPNKVVLMLGGLGTRLRPLTENTPKPLLKVGGKPIVETIVESFKKCGFTNFVFCVNYKAEMIRDYFKDGSDFGINIEYVYENKRMGTAGALSLMKEKPSEPFFVMNGDLLTNINFEYMLEYHLENKATATMAVREYEYQVPFGVVNIVGNEIKSIEEKPTYKFFVSGGIYILNPECIDYIPKNQFYDMPTLFEKLIKEKKTTISFPIREYWLDIGRIEEFEKAQNEYKRIFGV
ncbi:nucleotidyltransferase family protein [Caminibacter sp.]